MPYQMFIEAIHSSGESYSDVARAIGMTPRTFWNKVNGNRKLTVVEFLKLCDYLNIDLYAARDSILPDESLAELG